MYFEDYHLIRIVKMQHLNKEKCIYWVKIIAILRVYFGFSKVKTNWSVKS